MAHTLKARTEVSETYKLWPLISYAYRGGAPEMLRRLSEVEEGDTLPSWLGIPVEGLLVDQIPDLVGMGKADEAENCALMETITEAVEKVGIWIAPSGRFVVTGADK